MSFQAKAATRTAPGSVEMAITKKRYLIGGGI